MTINDDFTREMLFTPADAEAERLAVAEHEPRYTAEGRDGFAFGFAAGLAHARKWRALTGDPATWPPIEKRVLFTLVTGYVAIGEHVDMPTGAVILDGEDDATYHLGDSLVAWLPLPEPPKGEMQR